MKKSSILLASCLSTLLLPVVPLFAAAVPDAAPAASSGIDPDAMAALDQMGAALRAHNTLDVKADVTTEDVLGDGEKLLYAGTVEVQAQRPDRFRISTKSDTRNREFYYDGKSVTVYSPRLGLYAAFPAPATIAQTLDKASKEYDVEMPLADLFSWGVDKSLAARVQSAFMVRPEHVGGQICNHYAFRQPRVDWQVWIAKDTSLPCKIVITDRTDPSMPQYTSVLRWSFPASIGENVFAFAPPSGAHKIVIAKLGADK